MRRVVITGLGGVTPLGNTLEDIVESVKHSKCGISEIERFDTKNFKVKLAGEIKDLNPEDYLDKKSIGRMDRVDIFGVIAGIKAVEDSNIDFSEIDKERVSVSYLQE